MSQPVWSPSAARVAKARLTRFIAGLGERGVSDYPSLYAWSLEDPESFWAAVWRFCGVVSGRRWDRVLEGGDRMPGARWFPGATLNFAENLMGAADERPAAAVDLPVGGGDPAALQGPDVGGKSTLAVSLGRSVMRWPDTPPTMVPVCE